MTLFNSNGLDGDDVAAISLLAADTYTTSSGVDGWVALDAGDLNFLESPENGYFVN